MGFCFCILVLLPPPSRSTLSGKQMDATEMKSIKWKEQPKLKCSIMQGSYGEETMLCHWLLLSQEWLMSSRYLTTSPEQASQLEECR